MSSPCHVHVHAGVYNTNCICNEESSLYVAWSKSSNGEVVTTFKSFIRFINNRLHNYINPIFVHAIHVCE